MEPLVIIAAYLLGSIPFGLLLTRAAGLGDVRKIGSGNIGATNVMRTGKKWLGVLTLLLDVAKGYGALLIAALCMAACESSDMLILAAAMAGIIGHCFPVWLKFKGGKGVATALGVLIALKLSFALQFAFFWLLILAMTRMVSLASILAFWALLAIHTPNGSADMLLFFALLALLITQRHCGNLARIRAGTEPKVGKNKT